MYAPRDGSPRKSMTCCHLRRLVAVLTGTKGAVSCSQTIRGQIHKCLIQKNLRNHKTLLAPNLARTAAKRGPFRTTLDRMATCSSGRS